MNVLAIETATDHVSVAIGSAEGLAGSVEVGGGRRHAETLAPAIDWLCRTSGVDLSEGTMIAADVGPGLFTGMRVGLATASTMAVALGVPTFAACSLDLVAFPLRHSQRPVAAVLDARKGELFHALYVPVHGGLQRITEPQVSTLDDVIADLRATGHELVLAGDGAVRHADELRHQLRADVADRFLAYPSATTLLQLASAHHGEAMPLTPMYLRPPDAQINWATREAAS